MLPTRFQKIGYVLVAVGCWQGWSAAARANEDVMAETNPLYAHFQKDGNIFVLTQALKYKIETTKRRVNVPDGFVTDFASVPDFAQSLISVVGPQSVPAVLHDYLYWDQSCTRKEADAIFAVAMAEYEVPWIKRHIVYWAVRLLGWTAWNENEEERARGLPRILPPESYPLPVNLVWKTYREELLSKGVKAEPRAKDAEKPSYCSLDP